LIRASYYEIYNENIIDLLAGNANATGSAKQGLELKESPDTGIYIKDLTTKVVKSVEEIDAVLRQGHKNRSVGATLMNQGSSRSHAVFSVVIESQSVDEAGVEHIRVGKLNLVDLAVSSLP
jgi:kinesin family protein 3/17